jgi:hypothetical protein
VTRRPAPGAPLSDLVGKALAPAMSQHGFATSELIARWADLVGPRFAPVTRPLRVVWPRVTAELVDRSGRPPATLVVQCEGAHALELQHAAGLILEKVNVLYGWRAVERLSIRQGPVRREGPAKRKPEPSPAGPELRRSLETVEDEALREALERLGRAIAAERRVTKP